MSLFIDAGSFFQFTGLRSGEYRVESGCDRDSCCCLTGIVSVQQIGQTVLVSSDVEPEEECGTDGPVTIQITLQSANSTEATFTLRGQDYRVTKTGDEVVVANLDSPQCSGTAKLVTDAAAIDAGVPVLCILLSVLVLMLSI